MTVLQIFYRDNYGKTVAYPANRAASLLTQLTATRTLSEQALTLAKELGHTVEVVTAPPRIPGV
jgi:hypothetical protein